MLIGFCRSESLHKLNYTTYLGDGDSKNHANVVSADIPVYPGKTFTGLCSSNLLLEGDRAILEVDAKFSQTF